MVQSSSPPDLIFLDVQSEGSLACRTISERTQTRIIPIILLTDIRDDTSEAQAFEVGAADFIQKSIAPSVLKARTRTLLRLKRTNDLLDEVARMDPLTEIPNRREYDRVVSLEWRQSVRTGKSFSIILIDIDHFKEYNDNYGHVEGDACLRRLAHLLQYSIHRPTDSVARYGGEEFMIILPGTDEKGAMNVAQLIKDKLQKLNIPHSNASESRQLTISQGVASCTPTVSENPETILMAADRALYEAKRRGRNQIISAASL